MKSLSRSAETALHYESFKTKRNGTKSVGAQSRQRGAQAVGLALPNSALLDVCGHLREQGAPHEPSTVLCVGPGLTYSDRGGGGGI